MTSREIVKNTLEYKNPGRVARSFEKSDFSYAGCTAKTYATDWEKTAVNRWERTDEWGNLWARVDPTSKGEVIKGVLEDIKNMDTYLFPDYSGQRNYTVVAEKKKQYPDKWLVGGMPGFAFNIARKMLKLDQYLIDLIMKENLIHSLHNHIDIMLEQMINNYAKAGVDAVMFPEDWGTQNQTLISPGMWQKEFYPRFLRLCSMAHQKNIKVFMHSCGNIGAIIPGLIKAGIDVLQFDQPDLHGIDNLAAYQEKSKITFWCPVDIQKTLQQKNETIIRAKAREMLDKLWKGRGGFIAGYYGDNQSIGLDPKWQLYACEEFKFYGVISNYKQHNH